MDIKRLRYFSGIIGQATLILCLHLTGVRGEEQDKTVVYAVIGAACAVVVIAVAILFCCLCIRPKRKRQNKDKDKWLDQPKDNTSSLVKDKHSKPPSRDSKKQTKPEHYEPTKDVLTKSPIYTVQPSSPVITHPDSNQNSHDGAPVQRSHSNEDDRNYASEPNLYQTSNGVVRGHSRHKTEEKSKSANLPAETIKSRPDIKLDMSDDGVVRGFSNMSVRTKASVESRYVAKAYSNLDSSTLPKLNADDRYTARVSTRPHSQSNSTGRTQKTDSGYGSNARLTSLSDWAIGGKAPHPSLERSHSYVSDKKSGKKNKTKTPHRATSFQVKDSMNSNHLHYYRPAIIRESEIPSRSNSEIYSQNGREKSSGKGANNSNKHSIEDRSEHLHYAVLQHPKADKTKTPKRSASDASELKQYKETYDDPNALYAKPAKSKRHSAEIKKRKDSESSTPPPIPPHLNDNSRYHGVTNAAYRHDEKVKKIRVEAVVEKEPRLPEGYQKRRGPTEELRSEPDTSYSVKGKRVAHDAFRFLEDFDDATSVGDHIEKPRH